jgi:hypothetical protein
MHSKCQRYRAFPHHFCTLYISLPILRMHRLWSKTMASKIGRSIAYSLGKPLANKTASLAVRRGHVAAVCSLSVFSKLKSPPLWRCHNVDVKRRPAWERSLANSPSDEAEILDAYSNAIISVSFASQPHWHLHTGVMQPPFSDLSHLVMFVQRVSSPLPVMSLSLPSNPCVRTQVVDKVGSSVVAIGVQSERGESAGSGCVK